MCVSLWHSLPHPHPSTSLAPTHGTPSLTLTPPPPSLQPMALPPSPSPLHLPRSNLWHSLPNPHPSTSLVAPLLLTHGTTPSLTLTPPPPSSLQPMVLPPSPSPLHPPAPPHCVQGSLYLNQKKINVSKAIRKQVSSLCVCLCIQCARVLMLHYATLCVVLCV